MLPWNQIHNHIRGLSPYPAAWTYFINNGKEESIKIYKSPKQRFPNMIFLLGKLIRGDKKEFKSCRSWRVTLELLEIQLPGKRKMAVKEVLNGLILEKDAHLR